MGKNNYNHQMLRSYSDQQLQNNDSFGKALTDVTSSDMPGKWIAGVGLAAMAVAGIAIKAISNIERGK